MRLGSSSKGFTIIEIMIVIVISGLIIAGIVQGRSMIEEAKMRVLISEFLRYETAVKSFELAYDALPGDFTEATTIWPNIATENGNGDGQIDFKTYTGGNIYEGYRAWQHLSIAGILPTPYNGDTTTEAPVLEEDIPRSRSGAGYYLFSQSLGSDSVSLLLHSPPVAASESSDLIWRIEEYSLTPNEAYSIDSKIDDGHAGKGRIRGITESSCLSTRSWPRDYDLAQGDELLCNLYYILSYGE